MGGSEREGERARERGRECVQVTMKKGDVKEEKLSCRYPCKLKSDVPSFRKKKFVAVTKVDPKLRLSLVLSFFL